MATAQANNLELSRAKYLVLENPESAERQGRILGSVVPESRKHDPYKQYRPHLEDPDLTTHPEDLKKLKDLSAWLWKEKPRATVVLKNTVYDQTVYKDTDAQAQLTDLFRASISKFKGHDVHITAGEARRYTIDNAAGVLSDQLVRNEPWMAQLNKLYDDIRRSGSTSLCLVTGVVTCKGLEVSWKHDEERGGVYEAKLPIGQAAVADSMIATKLNIGLKLDKERKDGSQTFARYDDEVVFALAYDRLDLVFEDPPEPTQTMLGAFKSIFMLGDTHKADKRKIINASLGGPVRGTGIHPFASKDDEEDAGEFEYAEPKYDIVERPATPRDAPQEMDNGHA